MAHIRITDCVGRPHIIDTQNSETLAKWIIERIQLIKPSTVFPARLEIFPELLDDGITTDFPFKTPLGPYTMSTMSIISIEDVIDILKNHVSPVEKDCGG